MAGFGQVSDVDRRRLRGAVMWSRCRRLSLKTYQRLVSVSSREKLSTSRSQEADVLVSPRSRPFTSRAQDQFSAKLCRPQYAE